MEELQLPVPDMHALSNNEILTLILYLIESEFHFTGDGIWTELHTHHVENFNNLLPDFPESLNKIYKYGVKPSEKLSMQHLWATIVDMNSIEVVIEIEDYRELKQVKYLTTNFE